MTDKAPIRDLPAPAAPLVSLDTVEAVVRAQLSRALGGIRGIGEGAVPTAGFTICFVVTHHLRLSLIVGIGAAVALLLLRLAERSTPRFVANSLVGILVAAFFAERSGRAADVFLPGIIISAAYAAGMLLSVVVRWPLLGFLIGSVTGDPVGWHSEPAVVRVCSRLTLLLMLPSLIKFAVQYPLYLAGQVGWLGATKIALGWPLYVAALGGMAWIMARGRTPLAAAAEPAD